MKLPKSLHQLWINQVISWQPRQTQTPRELRWVILSFIINMFEPIYTFQWCDLISELQQRGGDLRRGEPCVLFDRRSIHSCASGYSDVLM